MGEGKSEKFIKSLVYHNQAKEIICKLFGEDNKNFKVYLCSGNNQYREIHWIRVRISANITRKQGFESVESIHIMPYRISREDIENAVCMNENKKSFNEMNADFVDYDPRSGNFHKRMNEENKIQIVLIQQKKGSPKGPGWASETSQITKDGHNVKCDWYFPNICDKNNDDSLEKLLKNVFDTILQDEVYNKNSLK